jgi:plastocyanin
MKKTLLFAVVSAIATTGKGTIHTITTPGFSFSPPAIQILAGDTVNFSIGGSHKPVEVSQATWNANGNTPLPGGFALPFGGGMLFTAGWSQGMHYYVCEPHAGMGMKGTINVMGTVGLSAVFPTASAVNIFADPAGDGLIVDAPGIDRFSVFDMSGRPVASQMAETSGRTHFPTAALSRGIYFFRLRGKDSALVTRKVYID